MSARPMTGLQLLMALERIPMEQLRLPVYLAMDRDGVGVLPATDCSIAHVTYRFSNPATIREDQAEPNSESLVIWPV